MSKYHFVCSKHQDWIDAHPEEAFEHIKRMSALAEQLVKHAYYRQAIPYLGTALESAEIIFDKRLESPQLTTLMTSITITLANAYAVLERNHQSNELLHRIQQKLKFAIDCAEGYATKAAFFKHCAQALGEAQHELVQGQPVPLPVGATIH